MICHIFSFIQLQIFSTLTYDFSFDLWSIYFFSFPNRNFLVIRNRAFCDFYPVWLIEACSIAQQVVYVFEKNEYFAAVE